MKIAQNLASTCFNFSTRTLTVWVCVHPLQSYLYTNSIVCKQDSNTSIYIQCRSRNKSRHLSCLSSLWLLHLCTCKKLFKYHWTVYEYLLKESVLYAGANIIIIHFVIFGVQSMLIQVFHRHKALILFDINRPCIQTFTPLVSFRPWKCNYEAIVITKHTQMHFAGHIQFTPIAPCWCRNY